jgi:hypothetical protein
MLEKILSISAIVVPLIGLFIVFLENSKLRKKNKKLIEDSISLRKRLAKRYELHNELAHVNSDLSIQNNDLSIQNEAIEKKYNIIGDKIIELLFFVKKNTDIFDGVNLQFDGVEDTDDEPKIITMVGTDSDPIIQE